MPGPGQMRVEPFLTLSIRGQDVDCVIQFNAQAVGISGGQRGTVSENVTHVITTMQHIDELQTGDVGVLKSIYNADQTMIVLDIDPLPFGATLYCRREDRVMVDP